MKHFKLKPFNKLVEEYRMPFGKHIGRVLGDINIQYLEWFSELDNISDIDKRIIKAFLQASWAFRSDIPSHIPRKQRTKYVMAKRENNPKEARRREKRYLAIRKLQRDLEREEYIFDH